MKVIKFMFAFIPLVLLSSTINAVEPSASSNKESVTTATRGEVKKINLETQKVTIKHEEIKNLDMPAMTMVFKIKNKAMLDNLKPGDKIKFKAENEPSGIVVTEIETVPN